ncbi:MAG: hypothetical protein M1483_02785 [Actinobacteria bacterium]|nr:hypothetical protein [Actinomycetota bacterium]MCL6104550.1 hypothetical protein [Actinomycetota bacterium]
MDRPSKHPAISSHEGAKRFAWNWMLGFVEEQLHAHDAFRILAILQGATLQEADEYATRATAISYLVELKRKA